MLRLLSNFSDPAKRAGELQTQPMSESALIGPPGDSSTNDKTRHI